MNRSPIQNDDLCQPASKAAGFAPPNRRKVTAVPGPASIVVVALTLLLGSPGLAVDNAQEGAGTTGEEPPLEDIIGKALTAYGGKSNLAQMAASSSFFGKDTQVGSSALPYRHLHKGDKWRTDVEVPTPGAAPEAVSDGADKATASAKSETSAFDGTSGWHAKGSVVLDMPGDRLAFLNEQEERQPSLLANWQDPGYRFELRGRTRYNQIPVFSLEITGKDGQLTTVFLDQNNYLVDGIIYQTELPEAESAAKGPARIAVVSVDYSEYRPTGGTMVPYKITRSMNGAEVETVVLESATIGGNIDDSSFSRPGASTAWHIPRSVTIPFDYSEKEILVKGRLNGSEELEFLLDTGASETIIDRRVAAEHFLAKQGQYQVAGIAGYVATESSVIKRLEIGNLILNEVQARILDLSSQSRALGRRVAGILGTNVISKFVTVIDYGKPSITFGDIDSYERPAKASSVPLAQKQAPFVKTFFNGHDEQVLLADTGAAFNHIPGAVAQKYVASDHENLHHVAEGTGLDGRPVQLGKVVVDSVSIGGLPVRKVDFTYPIVADTGKVTRSASSPHERGGFYNDNSFGILGNPFWENFIVTIDYKYQRMLLSPNPIVKIRDEIGQALGAGDSQLVLHRDYRLSELNYQKALMIADRANDYRDQAALLGRLGNLRRIMAKDLQRPEHAGAAYNYFTRAQAIAARAHAPDVEGRILADWSLLYSDGGQAPAAKATMDRALQLAPQDPNVNVDCAVHLYRAHLYPEMQRYVEKALFLEPSNWQALWYQVKLSETFYDTPKVVATLREILHYYPWSKVASDKLKSLNMSASPQPDTMVIPHAKSDTSH